MSIPIIKTITDLKIEELKNERSGLLNRHKELDRATSKNLHKIPLSEIKVIKKDLSSMNNSIIKSTKALAKFGVYFE